MTVNGLVAFTFVFPSLLPVVYGRFYGNLALRRKGYESALIRQYTIFAYLGHRSLFGSVWRSWQGGAEDGPCG